MARRKVNKSQAIRDYSEAHPNDRPKAIVQGLKKRKIKVSAQQVSTTLSNARRKDRVNGSMASATKSPKKPTQRPVTEYHPSVGKDQLKQAAALVRSCGGLDEALQAVRDAEEIGSVFLSRP